MGLGVRVGVDVGVAVRVDVGVNVSVQVAVRVSVGVGVGVAREATQGPFPCCAKTHRTAHPNSSNTISTVLAAQV